MKNNINSKIRVGLPKGGLKSRSLFLIEKLLHKEIDKRKLSFSNEYFDIYLLKHRDIPRMVESGLLDIGITSIEWIEENGNDVEILHELDWCNTRVSLITSCFESSFSQTPVKCITEFPNIARRYFEEKGIPAFIYKISGSSEACVGSIFNCCVDCVETGATLAENGLIEYTVLLNSKIVVISRRNDINILKNTIVRTAAEVQ